MVTEYDLHQYEGERSEGHHLGLFWIGDTIPFLMRIGRIGSIRYSAGDIRNKNDSLFLHTHTKRPPEVGFVPILLSHRFLLVFDFFQLIIF